MTIEWLLCQRKLLHWLREGYITHATLQLRFMLLMRTRQFLPISSSAIQGFENRRECSPYYFGTDCHVAGAEIPTRLGVGVVIDASLPFGNESFCQCGVVEIKATFLSHGASPSPHSLDNWALILWSPSGIRESLKFPHTRSGLPDNEDVCVSSPDNFQALSSTKRPTKFLEFDNYWCWTRLKWKRRLHIPRHLICKEDVECAGRAIILQCAKCPRHKGQTYTKPSFRPRLEIGRTISTLVQEIFFLKWRWNFQYWPTSISDLVS
jgi:hypothetical protein